MLILAALLLATQAPLMAQCVADWQTGAVTMTDDDEGVTDPNAVAPE
jgi:hypothetical protein